VDSTGYELLNFVHILAAAVWLGGAVMLQALLGRARRATDPVRLRDAMTDAAWVSTRLFVPASLVLVVVGFGLIAEGEWGFDPWIHAGITGWALLFLIGVAFHGRAEGRIVELLAEHPPDAAPVRDRVRRYFMVAGIETLLLVLILADMVVKPGL
jgi:uncharacterized membrane protein